MSERFCRDCVHAAFGFGRSWCQHPKAPRDIIYKNPPRAEEMRGPSIMGVPRCGPAGAWFEAPSPKPSLWKRLFG